MIVGEDLGSAVKGAGKQWCMQGGGGGGGVQGVQMNPPFFQIKYIHSMAWHACLACK